LTEARKTPDDYGDIDLVAFRLAPETGEWDRGTSIADTDSNTVANPSTIRDGSRLVLLDQVRPGKSDFGDFRSRERADAEGFVRVSRDDGHTWSAGSNITNQVLLEHDEQLPMFGPNRGISLSSGRLLVPMYYADQRSETFQPSAIYSDDEGISWNRSDNFGPGYANETAMAQVSNGHVLAIARNDCRTAKERKAHAVSRDGGATWAEEGLAAPVLYDGSCKRSLVSSDNFLFYSSPTRKDSGFMDHRQDGRIQVGVYDEEAPGNVSWSEKSL